MIYLTRALGEVGWNEVITSELGQFKKLSSNAVTDLFHIITNFTVMIVITHIGRES